MSFFDEHTEDKAERSTDEDEDDVDVELWFMAYDVVHDDETTVSIVAETIVNGEIAPIDGVTLERDVPDPTLEDDAGYIDLSDFQKGFDLEDEEAYEHEPIEIVNRVDPTDESRVVFEHPDPALREAWISVDRCGVIKLVGEEDDDSPGWGLGAL